LVIAVASYVTNMADNVMIGRLMGSGALGNYSLAFNIASAPIVILVFSLSTVFFPAYAEIISANPKRLEPAFTKVFSISLVVMLIITVPLFLLAEEIVQLLFGDRWTSAGTVLRVLAIAIPLRGLAQIISTAFWGLNRPKEAAVGRMLEAVVFLTALYPLITAFGLIAYAFACLNRLVALNKIMPGIKSKLLIGSLSTLLAGGAGLVIASFSLTFITSPLPRVILGGLISLIIPAVIMLLVKADLRKWIVSWFS